MAGKWLELLKEIAPSDLPREYPPKMLSVEHNQMVCALATDRANQLFNISVLPRRMERRRSAPNPHRPPP
jgi:hypothetical protein